MLGFDPREVKKSRFLRTTLVTRDVKVAKERQIERELNKDEEPELYERELRKLRKGKHNPQRVIRKRQHERYEWQFVSVCLLK